MDNFNFCFKAERTYVHGSDIYNSILRYLKPKYGATISSIELSIHTLSTHNMMGEILDSGQPTFPVPPAVVFKFDVAGASKTLYLVETDKNVDCRYEYDEESIVQPSQISSDQSRITVRNETPYTPIEVVIALNKKLMQIVHADEKGKWLFTRLALKQPLPDHTDETFTLSLAGGHSYRLTRSTIAIAGKSYGQIFFSMVKR